MSNARIEAALTSPAESKKEVALETVTRINPNSSYHDFLNHFFDNRLPNTINENGTRLGNGNWAIVKTSRSSYRTTITLFDADDYSVIKAVDISDKHYPKLLVSSSGDLVCFCQDGHTGDIVLRKYNADLSGFKEHVLQKGNKVMGVGIILNFLNGTPNYLQTDRFLKRPEYSLYPIYIDEMERVSVFSMADDWIAVFYPDENFYDLCNVRTWKTKQIVCNKLSVLYNMETEAKFALELNQCESISELIPIHKTNSKPSSVEKNKHPIAVDITKNKLYMIDAQYAIDQTVRVSATVFATIEAPLKDRSSLLRIHELVEDQFKEINRVELGSVGIKGMLPTGLLLLVDQSRQLYVFDPLKQDSRPQKLHLNIMNISLVHSISVCFDKIFMQFRTNDEPNTIKLTCFELNNLAKYYSDKSKAALQAANEAKAKPVEFAEDKPTDQAGIVPVPTPVCVTEISTVPAVTEAASPRPF